MSISITLHRSGTSRTQQVDTTTTGLDLFGSDRAVVAMRVDGNLVDLQRELHDGAEVEPVEATSEDGLNIIRHSATHVMACLLYTSPSPRDVEESRMPSSA